ncbi:MAG: hypothetical protein JRJ03_02010 [Deltaproteobacteria bacterium]|nr:hypothetical protein [Deltaproteobacteria bacterium]
MEIFRSVELSIPILQIAMLLTFSTLALLFAKVKLALLINYIFTMYWGYGFGWDYLSNSGFTNVDYFTYIYFGFGLLIVALAIIGFMAPSNR